MSEPVFALVGRFTEATALVYLYVALVPGVPELVVDPVEVHEADWVTVRGSRGALSRPERWLPPGSIALPRCGRTRGTRSSRRFVIDPGRRR